MRATDTPTLRFGHPVAAAVSLLLIVLNHTGALAAIGLTPELAFEGVILLIGAAAVIFGALDRRHGTQIASQLAAAGVELEGRPPVPVAPESERTEKIETDGP